MINFPSANQLSEFSLENGLILNKLKIYALHLRSKAERSQRKSIWWGTSGYKKRRYEAGRQESGEEKMILILIFN
jgi:hypothetical protein